MQICSLQQVIYILHHIGKPVIPAWLPALLGWLLLAGYSGDFAHTVHYTKTVWRHIYCGSNRIHNI